MLRLYYKERMYEIKADMFAYDGCHKIYLITNMHDEDEAHDYGYELWGVENLPTIWNDSCPLRFISFWDVENLKGNIVPQCEDAEIQLTPNTGIVTITPSADTDIQFLEDYIKAGVVTYV